MKLTIFFLIAGCLMVSAGGRAQNLTLSLKKVSIEKAFDEIQRQTGYEFLYSPKIIKEAKPVDIQVKNADIKEVLRLCFKNQPFSFTLIDKTVVLKPAAEKPASSNEQRTPVKKRSIVISGKVFDENGKAMSGVTVRLKGTELGTATDKMGSFTLPVPDNSPGVLLFTYLGYESQEYTAKETETISIVMKEKLTGMDEVVVVGYGTQKKKDILGAVSTITSDDIKNSPTTTSMFEILNGRMTGLSTINRSGQPGKNNYDLTTRGNSNNLRRPDYNVTPSGVPTDRFDNDQLDNFNYGGNPLVLIDGFEGDMNMVNPQDVESVTLLKDASAAIYGIRAANGVLLITTKRGAKGKVSVNYQYNLGRQSVKNRPEFLPSWQQAVLVNETINYEGLVNSGIGGGIGGIGNIGGSNIGGGSGPVRPLHKFTEEEIQKFKDGSDPNYPNTDWMDLVYQRPGVQQQHNMNISGGDNATTYRMSFEYVDDKGNIEGVTSKRLGSRINLTSNIFKTLKIDAGLNFAYAPKQEPGGKTGTIGDIFGGAYQISPMVPLKYQNGAYSSTNSINPIAWLNAGSFYKGTNSTMNGNIAVTWTPIEDLIIKPSLGFNLTNINYQVFGASLNSYLDSPAGTVPVVNQSISQLINFYSENTSSGRTITPQITVGYQKVKGDHMIGVLAGATQTIGNSRYLFVRKQNLLNNSLQSLDLASADGQQIVGSPSENVQQSVFGRAFYNYADRYYFEYTLRGDGTTVFSPDRRWGVFPSYAAAWLVSNESFFQNSPGLSKAIDFLKVRGSWSRLGNNSIGNFSYLTTLTVGNTSFNNQVQPYLIPTRPGNPNIRWEETTVRNLGLDVAMFKRKVRLNFDVYHKTTDDILLGLTAPANFGYLTPPAENVGNMSNKGMEVSLEYGGKAGQVNWSAKGNFSYNKNRITNHIIKTLAPDFNALAQNIEGYSYQALFGLQAEGIYQTQDEVDQSAKINDKVGPGDIRYKDQNGDGKITEADKIFLGNSIASQTFGLALNGSWKRFDISLLFGGSAGRKVNIGSALGSIGDYENKATPAFWNRWTPENPTNEFPRAWAYNTQNNPQAVTSSFWVRDASYVRLRSVTMAYSINPKWLGKIAVKGARVFYSATNLFTYAPNFWKFLDPETSHVEASIMSYPSPSSHSFGVNVMF